MGGALEVFGARAQSGAERMREPSRQPSRLTRLTCSDCGGVLAEQHEGDFLYYRCRVGHTFSPETLNEEKSIEIEEALWTAIQVLEEQVDLTERIGERALRRGNDRLARHMEDRAKRYRERAATVRTALPTVTDATASSNVRSEISS